MLISKAVISSATPILVVIVTGYRRNWAGQIDTAKIARGGWSRRRTEQCGIQDTVGRDDLKSKERGANINSRIE